MVQIGLSVTMETSFRGANQEFSNVFHYTAPGPGPLTESGALSLIDEVVDILKNLHANPVTFKYARVWSSGGTPSQNSMIAQKALSGTGRGSTVSGLDKERAVLMQWPAGKSSTGKPVFLRKWFHSCGTCAGVIWTVGQMANVDPIAAADRTTIETEANKLRIIGNLDEWLLCAESGRNHQAPGSVHRFLEHHQLGDQWR